MLRFAQDDEWKWAKPVTWFVRRSKGMQLSGLRLDWHIKQHSDPSASLRDDKQERDGERRALQGDAERKSGSAGALPASSCFAFCVAAFATASLVCRRLLSLSKKTCLLHAC